MAATDANLPGELSVRVSRLIRAPRERVFEAWIKPELRRQWWLSARGDGPSMCEIDARVGGRYCLKQIGGGCETPDVADDYEWIMDGEFLEVVAPERLVFTWNVNHDPPTVDERVTVEFVEVAGGTEVTITHRGIIATHLRDGTEHGWTRLLEILGRVMERP